MDSSPHLHIIVLAAGASTRLGQPKQLVSIAGRPALQHVVSNAVAVAGSAVSVVLGAQAADLTRLLQHSSATVLINRQWEEGMAASIRCGVNSLSPGCDAVMLLLGDQVAVSASDLKRLVSAWNGQDSVIVASVYSGQLGVPAIFPRWCFSELLQLRGDQGAKAVINRHASRLVHVPMPNAALDLDTLEDVAAMQEHFRPRDLTP
ncbi:MAG: NTP transferase domain-containing protein [Steroidobacteraceae bacterium]